ncbi:MAG: ATP-binding protein [Desertifilum sp.]|nr:ATP-binding protein [Desertifilum sp.]
MSISTSVLEALLQAQPQLRSQIYFKPSLIALSHAMEDQVLAGVGEPLVIANFQQERFYRQEAHRYRRIAAQTPHVYVLAAPETEFKNASGHYETIAFAPTDELKHEWHLVVVGEQYASCLVCRERDAIASTPSPEGCKNQNEWSVLQTSFLEMDQSRRFEGVWTFDRQVSCWVANLLLDRIVGYRPELAAKVAQTKLKLQQNPSGFPQADPGPFAERLVTYLQAGQYKLLKAYSSIAIQERKERLINSITDTIRRSLNLDEILQVATSELGQALGLCRCMIYRCKATDTAATISHEFLGSSALASVAQQTWPLQNNPLFQEVLEKRSPVWIENTQSSPRLQAVPEILALAQEWQIGSWLMAPVFYNDRLLGLIELHHCGSQTYRWQQDEIALVEAIATQLGVALIQAEAYANLEDLNEQLEALDRTRSNLIAITGHELRTPLSTIQICLESLAQEPDMPLELRQVMLNTALDDAERLRELVQDFLTLSRLESGRVEWHPEPLPLGECVDLALSSVRSRQAEVSLPQITTCLPSELPLVQADGEWLVEVLSKLLDNACKFTPTQGQVTIEAQDNQNQMLEVTIGDTGRGIEPNRLEAVFDRFYQEEGALRRTTGGTGLGLAICRQIVQNWGGQIWAQSDGKDLGSQFRFTIPIVGNTKAQPSENASETRQPTRRPRNRTRAKRRTTLK